MSIISIPGYLERNGTIYYNVNVKLPLRSISVQRRYSDFMELVNGLCDDLGLSTNDFPYRLPPKTSVFATKKSIAELRKVLLSDFLNNVVRDRDLQNRPKVHQFLQLPKNFNISRDLFKDENELLNDTKFLISDSDVSISADQWLLYFRIVKSSINKLDRSSTLTARAESREQIQKYIRPNVEKLARSLTKLARAGGVPKKELNARTGWLSQVQDDIESILANREDLFHESANGRLVGRVFGRPSNYTPQETNETVGLDDRELFQQQIQIHKEQDQEVEQLRKVIARQRQIGEAINQEVEEQNEMLDRFSEEVDYSSNKLQNARARAKKIS